MSDAPVVVKTQLSHQRRKLAKTKESSYSSKIQRDANFNVGSDAKTVNTHLKLALKSGVKSNSLKQSKGTGASGSFKIGEVKPAKSQQRKQLPKAKPKRRQRHLKDCTKKPAAKKPAGEKKEKPKAKKPVKRNPKAKSAKKDKITKKTKAAAKTKEGKDPKEEVNGGSI
ncbi:H1_5 [Mytilus coruscus]|uniref:H1_5 n=1 Tax=Mytilus coruscus TaxID=42192 RepID=A0A6J8CC66_MYTCO|nr:H1_5 [Mytilus coruscus]